MAGWEKGKTWYYPTLGSESTDAHLENLKGLAGKLACFYGEQTLLCSVEVADRAEAACEQTRYLLLVEDMVGRILSLVTMHPAVGTPGFLKQSA